MFNDLSFQDALDTFPDEVRLVARETTRDSGKPSSTSAHSPAQPLSSHEELVKLVTELKDGFFQPMDACSKSWHGEDGFERRLGECMAPASSSTLERVAKRLSSMSALSRMPWTPSRTRMR